MSRPPFEERGGQYYRKGKLIGWITDTLGTKSYVSPRKHAEHYLRNLDGWAMGTEHLRHLKDKGVAQIRLVVDGKYSLEASIDTWLLKSIDIHYSGYEPQKALQSGLLKVVTK